MRTKTTLSILLSLSPFMLFAQLPPGSIASYPLDNNTAPDVSGNGYNGTLTSTFSATNRFGNTTGAIGLTAGSSTGTLPGSLVTALKDDFSIGYWFNTIMTAPSGTYWYSGAALVDAEVCGGTNDWGTALIDGGKVSMGIGNPDLTIKSTGASYNDGNWHFLTATRNESAGVIILYVDGAQVATTSGTSTTALTAPNLIGLGRNPCVAGGVYTGSLDDILAYNRVLSSTEVTNLYNYYTGQPLPLTWTSFTGQAKADEVILNWQTANVVNNDHFEIERSTDGNHFFKIGSLPDNEGMLSYSFTDPFPIKGNDYYRIKQVDLDRKYAWSPIVEVTITPAAKGLYLQTNPVADVVTLINSERQMIQRMQVMDLSGRILSDRVPNSTNFSIDEDIQRLKPGYYLLSVKGNNTAKTLAFIKL